MSAATSCATFSQDFTDAHMAEHGHWLAPHHYIAETGQIRLAVHSWLLQVGGKKILIDSCCGNNKVKPGRPFWSNLNEPYLERLAAAGARPDEIDLVMCTHLHHDHVGWNTRQQDGKWVPTFPKARYVFSKPDVDYFSEIDADPKEGPAELGTFRECVVPILEYGKADLVSGGPHRLNDFIEIDAAPGHSPGHVVFKLESKGSAASSSATCGIICCRSITRTGISPRIRTPRRRASAGARCSPIARRAARWCFPAMSALPFAGRIEKTADGFRPDFKD